MQQPRRQPGYFSWLLQHNRDCDLELRWNCRRPPHGVTGITSPGKRGMIFALARSHHRPAHDQLLVVGIGGVPSSSLK